ncbi:hypothetical protein ILUMI_09503 [Ignelater luminosus]|uniref:HAT C-terminal dimerisation domain-containing protein n=1 Tax=Ignelater luminosus TaxID=2038154 RepID=A0A8K0GEZ8_IGNLU|nr:hypothetical protein ILUMI_09503 [Ignelater luminosus]
MEILRNTILTICEISFLNNEHFAEVPQKLGYEVLAGKCQDITSQLDTQKVREKEENRAAIRPIIDTILFCAEQELPLRSDCDSGPLALKKSEKKMLNFELENSYQRNNEESKQASCFTLLADETMDVSGTEQFSIYIRYIHLVKDSQTPIIREDFVGFLPIHDQSSENLVKVILKRYGELGLDMTKRVGQECDGAATMAGHISGVQSKIRQNCLGTINEVANMFRNHSYANKTLRDAISVHAPDNRKRRLLRLCETKFIKRHDSVSIFVEFFNSVCISPEEISKTTRKMSSTASALLAAMERSEFLVLLPGFVSIHETKLENLAPYFDNRISLSAVNAEYELWCEKASTIDANLEVLKVLEYYATGYFRTIRHLLNILATLPVTTVTVERSFSTIKRVKTLPRSVMSDNILSALVMISVHWDVTVGLDKVIDIMAGKKIRRLLL